MLIFANYFDNFFVFIKKNLYLCIRFYVYMRQRLYIFIFFALSSVSVFAQSAKQADDLFNAREYAHARSIYEALLRKQPTHPLYLYRAARCAQELGELDTAEKLFIQAGTKYPLRNFFLGEIYYQQWRMQEAIASYETFLLTIDEQHDRWPVVQERIASAQVIARYLKHVSRIEVIGSQRIKKADLISAYHISEDNGILAIDSLGSSFTTQRGGRRYYAVRTAEIHHRIIEQDSLVRDSVVPSRTMLVSRQKLLDNWEAPDTLRAAVNSGNTNTYPFVLTDGTTLYFASDREGGLGGLDIYMTRYNAALGDWMPAENIGMPYNSPYDDYLYAADEVSGYAYFATNRHCAGTDSVEVYQIALSDRTFLRGLPDNELIALARLDSIAPLLTEANARFADHNESSTSQPPADLGQYTRVLPAVLPSTATYQAVEDSIFFVLNDSETYTSLSDFRSDSARTLYEQYIELEQKQSQAIDMLDSLRHQYHDADPSTRASLQARIPILSGEIDDRKQKLRRTLSEIRALETAR